MYRRRAVSSVVVEASPEEVEASGPNSASCIGRHRASLFVTYASSLHVEPSEHRSRHDAKRDATASLSSSGMASNGGGDGRPAAALAAMDAGSASASFTPCHNVLKPTYPNDGIASLS
jgi:hypothetical protein